MKIEDVVSEEIESVRYIYPELEVISPRKCTISLPVQLQTNMVLEQVETNKGDDKVLKITEVRNLPPIKMHMSFPNGYPYEKAPIVVLSNVETWLSEEDVNAIYVDLYKLWEDFKDASIYNYIDYIKTQSEVVFGKEMKMQVNETTVKKLKEEDIKARHAIFNNETFSCDICQNEQKGGKCTKLECDHIFCNSCLNDYFTHIIERGEIENVHCPSFECTIKYNAKIQRLIEKAINGEIADFKAYDEEFFQLPVDPKILILFLPDDVSEKLVERYITLFHKMSITWYRKHFPSRVTDCPRSICSTAFIRDDIESRLAICPTCNFAYCCDCFHSWHGEINQCSMYMKKLPIDIIETWIENHGNLPRDQKREEAEVCSNIVFKYGRKIVELAVNDHIAQQKFEELVRSGEADIVRCPSCKMYIQRADGCNKMTCSKCLVFFCNLCGDRLDRLDPYEHYNNPMGCCFGKLFEGMISEEIQ